MRSFVLLKSYNDADEALIIQGLLETNGIEVNLTSRDVGLISGEMGAPIPQYNIFVRDGDLLVAKELLETFKKTNEDIAFKRDDVEEIRNKTMRSGRLLLLLLSVVFAWLSYLPLKTTESHMQYVLLGISLFFIILFLFTFQRKS